MFMKNINETLSKIQVELKAKKSRYNSFGKYNYRSAEDILEALKPFNVKYDVNVILTEEFVEFGVLGTIKSIARITDNDGGNFIEACAFAGVEKAGGMAVPQAFGSASSYAKKYALGNLFLLDDTADADASNNHKDKVKPVLEGDALEKAKIAIKDGKYTKESILKMYDVKGKL